MHSPRCKRGLCAHSPRHKRGLWIVGKKHKPQYQKKSYHGV